MSLIADLKKNLINIPGWRTNRKIVVFESDDWGSIRMRSKNDYDSFLEKGYEVDKCPYNRNDSLESNDDLIELFNILDQFKDINDNHPIFTLNNIVTNPDFKKIKEDNYQNFYFEIFIETLKKYPNHDKVFTLYHEGMNNKLIQTQFHGREHLNVRRYMKALQENKKEILAAFEREMFTVNYMGSISGRKNYLDTFGLGDEKSIDYYRETLSTGMKVFTDLWGFTSKSFIAPTYVWPVELEEILSKLGVEYLQGTTVQRIPKSQHEQGIAKKYHYLGQKNKFHQYYLIRNAYFEPASELNKNWVDSCLSEIALAFKWKKPAIISTHRVNYIGGIHRENREDNLRLLNDLLKKIMLKYPDVEFFSSDQLGDLISNN